MIFGNLENVWDGEETIMEAVQKNNNQFEGVKKPTKISKILTMLSRYGMSYDDKVYKNMVALPADKLLQPKDPFIGQTLYGNTGFIDNWKVKGEEEKSFSEKTIQQKVEVLRKMASQPELEDILDTMANECIVYDDNEAYICTPFLDTALIQELNERSADEIRAAVESAFYKIYLLLNWKRNAWNDFHRFLVDGILCFEITYDDLANPKSITGIVPVNPATLTKVIEDGITYWIQFKDVVGQERKLLDTQIIYIKYEDTGVSSRQSYLERLIRPFNIYRIVEQAQVVWTVTQSSFKTMFTIPVAGMNKAKGMQTLSQAMNRYKEDISFNTETGELQVNGKMNMPFNKEYWMAENENGKPEIETLVDNGPQLNDSEQLKYFEQKLFKMSKIPSSRFDKDAQSTWFGSDPTQQLREEINFGRFVNRIRNTFADIMLKPLRIQLSLSIPEIKNDKRILDSISLRFNSYNQFEEMANIEIMSKRVEFIGTMKDSLTITDSEGEEIPYFSPKFLILKYLKMSEADLELNEKYKREDKILAKLAKDTENGEDGDQGEDEENTGDELLGTGDEGGDEGGDEHTSDTVGDESEGDEGASIDDEISWQEWDFDNLADFEETITDYIAKRVNKTIKYVVDVSEEEYKISSFYLNENDEWIRFEEYSSNNQKFCFIMSKIAKSTETIKNYKLEV